MEENKDKDTSASHFQPVEDRWEWLVEHKTPNRAKRRENLKNMKKAMKKARRIEEIDLGQQ